MNSSNYNPYDWYWSIANDQSKYWSSKLCKYIEYIPDGRIFTNIDTEESLTSVLLKYNIDGPIIYPENVVNERIRRLSIGFVYDFNDVRGKHHIGTTEKDMVGWTDVSHWANSNFMLNNLSAQIEIVTDTGPVKITPSDWANILNEATKFRQPIWRASFILQEMTKIPNDYKDDKWWNIK